LGSVLWEPTAEAVGQANVTRYMEWLERERGITLGDYTSLWEWSVRELEEFWRSIWDFYEIHASTPYSGPVLEGTMPGARWFAGARLNYAEHILARASAERPALIARGESGPLRETSWAALRGQVGAVAAALRARGIGPGDRVAAYIGNLPEAVIAMLAVTSIGAIWTACAPDFGIKSVLDRFAQVEPSALIVVDGLRFGGREYDRLDAVSELQRGLPTAHTTILVRSLRPDREPPTDLQAACFDRLVEAHCEPEFAQLEFDHPLWVLYSSGTTGVPKGIVHSHGGILVEHLKSLGLAMDLHVGDRYFFYSSTSWMAWNYLVGGLLHGTTIVLYDGSPAYPDASGSWRVAAETRATTFGMGSAYVTACEKAGIHPAGEVDLTSLRTVIPTGSPLPPSGWHWLHDRLGRQVRIDPIAGGTDVCTAFVGGSPLLPVQVGEIPCRWPGVAVDVLDERGRSVRDAVGEFVITAPMPSMPIRLWNDPGGSRYRDTYFNLFPGIWRQGDWASISGQGTLRLVGRSDSTLNRGGVRMGSAEIYAVVEREPDVMDSLVVGLELPEGGYYMPLFVVLAHGIELDVELRDRLRAAIRENLSPRHVPDEILVAPAIPRTLTGKKLEVPVKRILQGVPVEQAVALGAVSAPSALEWFATLAIRGRTSAVPS
jgi:acetoacetyl-CoA synthetase